MPAVRTHTLSRKGLLLRYDGLIEVVDVDADHPEDEFGQGGVVAERSVCGRARLLWTHSALQEPENEMGTRLAQQRIHGDALLVFHHEVPWLKTVDPAQQFTLRSLLQVTLSHAPGGLPKHASHPVRPCIRTLVASILSSQAFPPRVHHREQPVPYPPHGAEQDTVADPADRHPPRASFDVATAKPDKSSPKPQPSAPSSSTDIQTQPASETPQPEAPSSPQAATLTAVPRRKRREVITTPQQQAATPSDAAAGGDSNRASTSTVYTQSRRRHYHPEGTAKGCPGCNPPPQIHAIHAYLEKKRQKQLQEEMLEQQDSAPALSQATAETRKHGAASAADNDDLVNHKRAHLDTEATDSTGPSSYPLVAATAPSQGLFAGPPAALGPAGISGSTVADTSGLFEPYDLSPPGLSAAEPATTQPTFLPPAPALPPQRTGGAAEILMQDAPPGGVAEAAWPLVAPGGEGQEAAVPVAEWDALHPDVLHLVFKKLNCEDLVSVSGVCTAWRDAAVRDRMALEKMEVKLAAKPLRAPSAALGAVIGMRMLTRLETLQLPRVVRAAADNSGNPSACFVCASVCEVRADMVGAASYWKKAARGGEVQAMYKLGSHFYHGDIPSLGRSGEDAVMWLQRFIKAVDAASASSSVASTKADQVPVGTAAIGSSCSMLGPSADADAAASEDDAAEAAASDAGGGGGRMLGSVGRTARARQRVSNSNLQRQIASASLLLGYLHMDGEGTKVSNLEAVRHMRRASMLGDEEAHRTLGWMYNTGQFGEGS